MNRFEEALGTRKLNENETWEQVFARVNKERGFDIKTVTRLLVAILEEIDNGKSNTTITIGHDYPYGVPEEHGQATVEPEDERIFGGTRDFEEETPSGTRDKESR